MCFMGFFYGNDVFLNMVDFNGFSSSSDEEMFQKTHKQHQNMYIVVVMGIIIFKLFNTNELEPNVR
jgi:hypothetical protein